MYLDKITNKLYPFIKLLLSNKNIESYEDIFKNIIILYERSFRKRRINYSVFNLNNQIIMSRLKDEY